MLHTQIAEPARRSRRPLSHARTSVRKKFSGRDQTEVTRKPFPPGRLENRGMEAVTPEVRAYVGLRMTRAVSSPARRPFGRWPPDHSRYSGQAGRPATILGRVSLLGPPRRLIAGSVPAAIGSGVWNGPKRLRRGRVPRRPQHAWAVDGRLFRRSGTPPDVTTAAGTLHEAVRATGVRYSTDGPLPASR